MTEPGFLCLGCCSHHVSAEQFAGEAWAGIREAGRGGRLIRMAGAGPDHPIHPALPETAYLKFWLTRSTEVVQPKLLYSLPM